MTEIRSAGEYEQRVYRLWEKCMRQVRCLWAEHTLQYVTLLEKYERQELPLEDFERQAVSLRAKYVQQETAIWEDFDRQRVSLWEAGYDYN